MRAIRITDHGKMQHCSFYGFYQQVFFEGNRKEIKIVALISDEETDVVKTAEPSSMLFSEKAFLTNE